MTEKEARELLLLHAFSHADAGDDARAETGFLGSLRPYRGVLNVVNYHSVMQALRVLAPKLAAGNEVDRELIAALWSICHFALAWGVHPEGMLRRNGLIADSDLRRLADWVLTISYATVSLIDGSGEDHAFAGYDERER